MSTTPSRASAAELLAQRQWRKDAQRSVRCALTAIKKARTEFAGCSSEGQAALAGLANDILTALKLPGLQLGRVDKEVEGLRGAAAAKLDVRALGGVRALRGCVVEMGRTLQAADDAIAAVADTPITEPWHATSPVYASIDAPRMSHLMRQCMTMLRAELTSKSGVCSALEALTFANHGSRPSEVGCSRLFQPLPFRSGGHAQQPGANVKAKASFEDTEQLLTVYLTTWLLDPYLNDAELDEILAGITEDMVGF